MEAYGYSVTVAADQQSAETEIRRAVENGMRFDVGLVDQSIDRASGVIVCKQLERFSEEGGIRRILISNRGLLGEAAKKMNPGVDVHIAKPVRPSRLIAALTTGTGDHTNLVDDVMQTGAGGTATGETRALRLLLAEDNRVNQRVALAMLSKGGHEIDIANDGVEALMMVSKNSYDVILMDVQMPNMSGVDATRKIRRLPGPNSNVPIVAMTANAMVGDRESYSAAGMDYYVSKPIDPGMLSAALTRQSGYETVASAISAPMKSDTQTPDISKSDVDNVLAELDSLFEND